MFARYDQINVQGHCPRVTIVDFHYVFTHL